MPLRFKTQKEYQQWLQKFAPPTAPPSPSAPHASSGDKWLHSHPFTFAVLAIVTLFALYAIVVLWFVF